MKFLVIIPFLYWISLCECYFDPDCPLGVSFQMCDPDKKGFNTFDCYGENDNRPGSSKVKCKDKETCKCHIWSEDEYPEQKCKCEEARRPAPFHAHGVIRWNGTYKFNDEPTVDLEGEVYKDTRGNYLMWKMNYWGKRELEILISNDDGEKFVQYTYADAEKKNCTKKEVASEKYLHSIWANIDDYIFNKEENDKGNKIIQTWKRDRGVDDWQEHSIMTVKYDIEEKVATPIKFYTNDYSYKGDPDIYVNINYYYEPLGGSDTAFNVEHYCTNV